LYAKEHHQVIVGDQGDKSGAGDVFLRGVTGIGEWCFRSRRKCGAGAVVNRRS
jgi:hypothetical protein